MRCLRAGVRWRRSPTELEETRVSDPIIVEVFDVPTPTDCWSGG